MEKVIILKNGNTYILGILKSILNNLQYLEDIEDNLLCFTVNGEYISDCWGYASNRQAVEVIEKLGLNIDHDKYRFKLLSQNCEEIDFCLFKKALNNLLLLEENRFNEKYQKI